MKHLIYTIIVLVSLAIIPVTVAHADTLVCQYANTMDPRSVLVYRDE